MNINGNVCIPTHHFYRNESFVQVLRQLHSVFVQLSSPGRRLIRIHFFYQKKKNIDFNLLFCFYVKTRLQTPRGDVFVFSQLLPLVT